MAKMNKGVDGMKGERVGKASADIKSPIDSDFRHGAHGKDGSHQGKEKALGGKRRIVTGSPEEQ